MAVCEHVYCRPTVDLQRSYWGHVMPGLGTPKVKIQVIDLEHLIDPRRAQIQWAPSPLHARAPGVYQVL